MTVHFPHRASSPSDLVQLEYCIKRCGGICSGLFNTYKPDDAKGWWIKTMPHSREVETGRADGARRVMFAHIIATLGVGVVVTDNDIRFPENWRDASASRNSAVGHQTSGRTICLHSFAVCPEVQGIDIGKNAMKAYLQLMSESGMADRVALICKEVTVFTAGSCVATCLLTKRSTVSDQFFCPCRFQECRPEYYDCRWLWLAQYGTLLKNSVLGKCLTDSPSSGLRSARSQAAGAFGQEPKYDRRVKLDTMLAILKMSDLPL